MNNDLIHINTLPPFKRMCMTIGELPTSYLETMTYYEMLVWFTEYMKNTVIPTINNNGEAIEELQNKYVELKSYVDNYFENLDVQEEINNKLDEMAESGELTDIIAQYLGLAGVLAYDTVSDMKSATNLANGSICQTLGYHSVNDGGKALYKVRTITNDDVIDDATIISLSDNTLIAELVAKNEINAEMFGAYGDGTHDDHTALIKLFKYATTHYASYDSNNYESLTIKLNNKKYLNGSTITFGADTTYANTFNLDGNGSYITGYGFEFATNAGWKMNIKNINFANMTTAIELKTRNLEYGNYIIDNVEFVSVVNPFIINRQSCIVEIKNCIFRAVTSIGEITNVDRFHFHDNWIEPINTITGVDYKSMLKQNSGNESNMYIHNNVFVPVGGSNCKELCWIEVNSHARIYNNRFSGENVYYHPARLGAGFIPAGAQNSLHPYFSFDHNDDVHGATSIILESIAGNVLIEDNQGWIGGGKVLEWSDKISAEDQETMLTAQAPMLNLVVKNNVGVTFWRYGDGNFAPAGYIPAIPTNLWGLLNRGLHAINAKGGENRAYLGYTNISAVDTSYTITIKNQPFYTITGVSTAGKFELVNNFAILFWTGYGTSGTYIGGETYGIVTFELTYTDSKYMLTPHLSLFGREYAIQVKINGETSIDSASLNGVNSFTLTFYTEESNKRLKYLHAQIFRPENQLGCCV